MRTSLIWRLACALLLPAHGVLAAPPTLRIATWNLEWLLSPGTSHAARLACRSGTPHLAVPCDAALSVERSTADHARLRHYAERMDADVVAFQEVENASTAALVFPGYSFCLTASHTPQNLGFAIRRGLPFRCDPDYLPLAFGERGRRGAAVTIDPGGPRELHALGVHLKSGCSADTLGTRSAACRQLARQLPLVGSWMRDQRAKGQRHLVLGDFNRAWEADDLASLATATGDQDAEDPGITAGFRSCFAGQLFTRYIDHILVAPTAGLRVVAGSHFRTRYAPEDVVHYRLSDHCPTGLVLQFTTPPGISARRTPPD
jgi:endonuclease/exonuclease/phosphatase family metal-dependent hydrolase